MRTIRRASRTTRSSSGPSCASSSARRPTPRRTPRRPRRGRGAAAPPARHALRRPAGRVEQLQLAAREAFSARSCRHVVVVGEPGVGKSRLATELAVAWPRGARADGPLCAVRRGGDVPAAARRARRHVRRQGPVRLDPQGVEGRRERRADREFLVWAVSATSSPATSGDTQWAVRRLLEALAAKKPVLLVLEDVHWAEPTFLDLVEYVAGWSEDAPSCSSR